MPDTKITALTAITTVDPAVDVLPIVDVSDTTMAASGTTKKITSNQILGAGGTATLASATITGNLTVDTNVLFVDAANNRVGIGTTSPAYPFQVNGRISYNAGIGEAADLTLSSSGTVLQLGAGSAWTETRHYVAGAEAMRLNSTGLGVGVAPITGHRISSVGPIGLSGGPNSFLAVGNYCSIYYTDGSGSSFPFLEYGNLVIHPRDARNVVIATAPSAGSNTSRIVVKTNGQVRFVPLAADPSGAEAGDVYYNSVSNRLKYYNGTAWTLI